MEAAMSSQARFASVSVFGAAVAVTFLVSTSVVHADCRVLGEGRYRFIGETVEYHAHIDSGSSCYHRQNTRGSLIITGFSIIERPAHGTLSLTGANSMRYKPNGGFGGSDSYAVKICGSRTGVSGCSTVRYRATVVAAASASSRTKRLGASQSRAASIECYKQHGAVYNSASKRWRLPALDERYLAATLDAVRDCVARATGIPRSAITIHELR
jgi:hypothetical protein